MVTEKDVLLRPIRESDLPMVCSDWLWSFADRNRDTPRDEYVAAQSAVIKLLLSRSKCVVACHPEDPDTCFGWLVWEDAPELLVHYAYVKRDFRRMGVGRLMWLFANPQDKRALLTHASHDYEALRANGVNVRFRPFKLTSILVNT